MPSFVQVSAANATVTVSPSTIEDTGTDEATLTITALDGDSLPIPGIGAGAIVPTGVTNLTVTPVDAATDANGAAHSTVTSETADSYTIGVTIGGLAITDTAALEVTGDTPVPTLDFHTDWSTATGTSDAARRDTDKAVPWATIGGSSLEVIAATGLGFPGTMTNVCANRMVTTQDAWGEPRITTLDVIAIGETRYYRQYIRVSSDTDVIPAVGSGGDDETHGTQDGSAASQVNWGWWCYHNVGGAGKWTLQWRPSASENAFPNDRWQLTTALDKDVTYRREWAITRTGETTMGVEIRIFNEAVSMTVPVFTGADFRNQTSATDLDTFVAANDFTFFDVDHLGQLQSGLNGLAGIGTWGPALDPPLPSSAPFYYYAYQGGFATGVDCGFIGAYNASNEG